VASSNKYESGGESKERKRDRERETGERERESIPAVFFRVAHSHTVIKIPDSGKKFPIPAINS
jgi:hypothetical protein